jgi:hypothetical protein
MSKDKTMWQRRKHTATKPNWVIISTYNTVDWFGDFNGLKRSAANWIRRSILKVVDITILLCLFVFSAIHSFEMLQKFGITGVTQWLAIIFFEVNFLYSSVALDIAKKKGEPLGSRRAMFYICLAFVEASNITALWSGWKMASVGGVLVGGVMPIMLLLKKESYKKKTTTEDSHTEGQPSI